MPQMETKKDKIEMLSKIIDGLYKKLVILVAVSGGFGAYGVKFTQESNWIGFVFILISVIIAIAIFLTYIGLNDSLKEARRIYNE